MFKRILVPLDGTRAAERALPYASELARALDGSLVVIRTTDRFAEHEGLASHAPQEIIGQLAGGGDEIVAMAACPHSVLHDAITPSPANVVVAAGRAPVLVVDPHAEGRGSLRARRVVVALDGSEFAQAALPVAGELASALDCEIVLLQTVNMPPVPIAYGPTLQEPAEFWPAWRLDAIMDASETSLQWMAERLRARFPGLQIGTDLALGDVADEVNELKAATGLVVMATHARSGLSRLLLGSPADDVFRRDHVPVLLVHPRHAAPAPPTRAFSHSQT
jgi:nucleotide-binding universal stress UspA family protein